MYVEWRLVPGATFVSAAAGPDPNPSPSPARIGYVVWSLADRSIRDLFVGAVVSLEKSALYTSGGGYIAPLHTYIGHIVYPCILSIAISTRTERWSLPRIFPCFDLIFFRLLFAVRKFVRMLNGCMFWQFMWRQIKTNTTNCPPLGLLFCLGLGTGTGVLYIISILMIFNHARLEAVQRRTPKANIFLANNKSQANFAWHLFWQFCIITSVSFWFNFFLNFIFRFSRISCGFLRCA